jgi:hypothetical protein
MLWSTAWGLAAKASCVQPQLEPPCCRYNFAKSEPILSYEHTRGSLKLGALYNAKVRR